MKSVKKVFIFLEIVSDKSTDDIQERVQHLLEYGGVRDCFDAADLDASHFVVERVEE